MNEHDERARALLVRWGFSSFFTDQERLPEDGSAGRALPSGTEPARVVGGSGGGGIVRVVAASGEWLAEPSGRLRAAARGPASLPVVGDWVHIAARPGEGRAAIHRVLARRTALARKAAGREASAQVLAANVDVVALVTAATRDANLRRIERWLAAAWSSGAAPVVVLTKADLHDAPDALAAEVAGIAIGVPVIVTSAVTGVGLDEIRALLAADADGAAPGQGSSRTAVLVGNSGAGKSTLTNALLGREAQATGEVRADDERGRHTTSSREALLVPGGGVIIDGPGVREIALACDDEDVAAAFPDIAETAAGCRFRDCHHAGEPGCAVLAAIERGALAPERLASWDKLGREAAFQRAKVDERARIDATRERKRFARAVRARMQMHDKRNRR